ncbi:hypothetical protein HMPREF1544_02942 [Mucor circinelloides 1006PhL]|uniref:Uncharacterized protein n=1 Tax=Mucor circinelloides f. circinelloides (strain 1006PhL) TaxID=1220926 RepID=S2JIW0_MUCC1|nr:hypothetical protein HMPREF1544_02942 [Mucor circinelloides 1006PhL]
MLFPKCTVSSAKSIQNILIDYLQITRRAETSKGNPPQSGKGPLQTNHREHRQKTELCREQSYHSKDDVQLDHVTDATKVRKPLLLFQETEKGSGEEEEEEDMMKTIKYLSRAIISNKAKTSCSSEASFSEKYIMPAIRRVILDKSSDSIIYAIIDKADKYKKKPDIMIGAEFKKKNYHFFFVEIKRPSTQSKYQAEDDYVKLLKEMKGSIDNQLLLGIENPSSLGLLVEGFTCTLFCPVLLTDGVYCPIAVKRFHLVGEIYEMINLPSIVEVLTLS